MSTFNCIDRPKKGVPIRGPPVSATACTPLDETSEWDWQNVEKKTNNAMCTLCQFKTL